MPTLEEGREPAVLLTAARPSDAPARMRHWIGRAGPALGLVFVILVFALLRYASVASIVAALSLPVASVALGEPWPVDVFAGAAALAVLVLHRDRKSVV